MNFNNVSITISAANINQLPAIMPEAVFAGKSNVGKSSMINKLLNRKNFARVSSTPGKTATINFYNIDNSIYFTDLPGYGYAKVSKDRKKSWGELMEGYFAIQRDIRLLFFLVDIRHEPSEMDKDMALWLYSTGLNFAVCGTKCDKLSKSQVLSRKQALRKELSLPDNIPIIPFSSETGEGRDELVKMIEGMVDLKQH